MKVLELFAGSRSIGKVCDQLGYECFSVDINDFEGIDLVTDIGTMSPLDVPFKPDIIWASPPCTTYSVAAVYRHRFGPDCKPKSKQAREADKLVANMLRIIMSFPDAKWYVENPRGMMRKLPMMRGWDRATVWYCQYGDDRAKPTDIFTNNLHSSLLNPDGWTPREPCFNGNKDCHHQPAPRGSRTGTQGLKGAYIRSVVPYELCREVLTSVKIGERSDDRDRQGSL